MASPNVGAVGQAEDQMVGSEGKVRGTERIECVGRAVKPEEHGVVVLRTAFPTADIDFLTHQYRRMAYSAAPRVDIVTVVLDI